MTSTNPQPSVREAVARVIGSYVVVDDHGGPDTEVLHDVIGGDYDEATRRVYELTDEILALVLRADPLVEKLRGALERLLVAAKLLQANSEGCAVNHYGEDFYLHGMPGFLIDTARDIEAAREALALPDGGGSSVAESAASVASDLTASDTPSQSEGGV